MEQLWESSGFYVSIITGVLLTISETLPYIKKVKSNGIIQFLLETLRTKGANSGETTPLLSDNDRYAQCVQQMQNIQDQLDTLHKHTLLIKEIEMDKKLTIIIESMSPLA